MQLKELEYLLKTVECGSITKAAEQMFISQPTLHAEKSLYYIRFLNFVCF